MQHAGVQRSRGHHLSDQLIIVTGLCLQVMKMMGLSNAVHWCAWFLTTCLQMMATTGMLTAMLKVGKVLPHSDPFIIFIVLQVYAIAVICFS